MLRARLTEELDGRICLETLYHSELVSWLKTLPSGARAWDPDRKRWLLSALYVAEVLEALEQFQFEVQDDRGSSADLQPGEGAALWAPSGMPQDLASAFYQLGLNGEAPLELAVYVWRWWLRFYHPDVNGTGEDEQAKRLNDAMETIRTYLED